MWIWEFFSFLLMKDKKQRDCQWGRISHFQTLSSWQHMKYMLISTYMGPGAAHRHSHPIPSAGPWRQFPRGSHLCHVSFSCPFLRPFSCLVLWPFYWIVSSVWVATFSNLFPDWIVLTTFASLAHLPLFLLRTLQLACVCNFMTQVLTTLLSVFTALSSSSPFLHWPFFKAFPCSSLSLLSSLDVSSIPVIYPELSPSGAWRLGVQGRGGVVKEISGGQISHSCI